MLDPFPPVAPDSARRRPGNWPPRNFVRRGAVAGLCSFAGDEKDIRIARETASAVLHEPKKIARHDRAGIDVSAKLGLAERAFNRMENPLACVTRLRSDFD